MLEDISVLYVKKDSEIDETLFKECLKVDSVEEANTIFKKSDIALLICDLEVENSQDFIKKIKKDFINFPLVVLEKIPLKRYDFEFNIKLLKPFNLDGFRRKIKDKSGEIISFYEKNIQQSVTVADSIQVFFNNKNSAIEEIISSTNISKEMDFEIMKTFVNTTYNNFCFIDKKIEKSVLKDIKDNYEHIQWMYKNLLRATDKGIKELYRVIYLENNIEYKKAKKLLDEGKKTLFEFQKRIKKINSREVAIQNELDKSTSEEERVKLSSEKKALKGKYTDIVHNTSLIQETNHQYVLKLEKIEEEHIDEFIDEFKLQREDIKDKYKSILNKFTFYFNRQLWLVAKKSKVILDHFEGGQVSGFLNSKTYLEYFLANVDASKAGSNTKKMVTYLNNYNKHNRVNVAILTENLDFYNEYSPIIRKIDSTLRTFHYYKIDRFIKEFSKYNFEILLIDCFSHVIKSNKALEILKEKLPDNVIITSVGNNTSNPYIFKNFSTHSKDFFQRDFRLVL